MKHETASHQLPGGLLSTKEGYAFVPEGRLLEGTFAFTIKRPDGLSATSFEVVHDRELHLILASRDLRSYAHLHPERDETGRWSVSVPELAPGPYRAFADFEATGGNQLTLGVDLTVPGPVTPSPRLRAQSDARVAGFDVYLRYNTESSEATVTVRRDDEIVVTEPYLGAAGHLVGLREGDLGYLHVHPLDTQPVGPVRFVLEFPSAGTFALFFDFQVDGEVHTAPFVINHPT